MTAIVEPTLNYSGFFMPSATTEKQLETAILDWLNLIDGCFAIKINMTGIYDARRKVWRKNNNKHIHNGTSDILACYRGRFCAIEVKVGYNKPSENQRLFIQRIKENGGVSFWTKDFTQCKVEFKKHFPDFRFKNAPLFNEVF